MMLFQITGKTIIKSICLIGCLSQVYTVTKRYFSFSVRKEMSGIVSEQNEIPDIHIAIELKYLIDLNEFHERKPRLLKAICENIVKDLDLILSDEETWQRNCSKYMFNSSFINTYMYNFLTVEQIESSIINPATFIRSVYLANDEDVDALKTGLCTVDTRFSASRVFLIISCSNGSQPLYMESFKMWIDKGYVMLIMHLFNFPYEIRLKSHGAEIDGYPQFYTSIKASTYKSLSFAKLRFHKKITQLLPWPYTSCRDYDNTYSAFIRCLNKHLNISKDCCLHKHTVISFGSIAGQTKFISVLENSSKHDECFQLTNDFPCNQVEYFLEIENFILNNTEFIHGIITIEKLSLFDILYNSKPEFPFVDCTVILTSVISIWYGFNIYDYLERHERKRKIYQMTSIETISRRVEDHQDDPSYRNSDRHRNKFQNNGFYTYLSKSKLFKVENNRVTELN